MRARSTVLPGGARYAATATTPVKLLALWVALMVLNPSLISDFSLCSSYGVPNILLNRPSVERTPILAFEFTFPMFSRLMNP